MKRSSLVPRSHSCRGPLADGCFVHPHGFLLRLGPLTKRFGDELVEQILRGHFSRPARSHSE